uniref:SUN domain-containing ossification factor-like isoform X2 n=1 Tax=Ciona intestinalis TaxID=7719 RepID=UPI00089DC289|nr:SUN domain-containing ossification factor-like isoform X2 [Ciona intestinalis]|eukprot:XP_018667956.1 SUN domain-containing ossification factor-like isoform X2 [Ciona intestinalis]
MPLRCFWIFLIGIILILSSSRHRAENIEKKEEETAKDVPISNEEQTENNFKLDKENESETPLDLKIETDKQIDEKNVKHENIPIIPDNTNVKFEKKSEETENENKENPQNTTESVVETSDSENLTKSPENGNIGFEADGSTHVTLNDEKISMEEMKTTTPGVEVEMVNDPKDQEIIDKILNQSVDEPTKEDVNLTKIVDEINNTILNDSHTESKPDVLPTTNDDLTQTVIEPKTTHTVHLNKAVDSEDQETTTTTTTTTTEVKTEEQNEQILEPKSKINKPEKEEETEAVPTADKEDTTTSNDNEVENTDKQEVIVNSNKTTTANAEEKQNEENVKLEVDSIQSFEEWKKKQIQDREEAAVKVTSQSPPRAIRTKKTQVNYASQDCGAKILTQNPEAKHVSAILDENKDMYMLNPCSANIWFVVELCEPIQIRQLQVANLELFSSAPHIFDISISERYPAREWRPLGTFEARNERTVQTFAPPREELMFAKYIKFEMKSHFGKEHFCPLTLIRVLGVSMVEEYEETEDKNNEKSEMGRESGEQKIIKNIHDDDVVNEDGKESGSIEKMFKIMKNAVGTLLGNGGSEQNTTNETNISNETLDEKTNKTEEDDKIDPKWESPVTLVTNKSEVAPPVLRKTPIVTLVETGDGQEVLMEEDFNPHLHSLRFLDKISRDKFTAHLCWFLELIYRVSVMSCIMQPYNNQTSADPSLYAYVLHKKVNQEQQVPPKVTEFKEKSKDFVKIEEVQKAAPLDDAVEPKKIKIFTKNQKI